MLVKFVRSDPPYLPGEIAGFEEEAAERLIRRGVAERHVVAEEAASASGAGAAEPPEQQPAPCPSPATPAPATPAPVEPAPVEPAPAEADPETEPDPAVEADQPAADPPTTTRRARR